MPEIPEKPVTRGVMITDERRDVESMLELDPETLNPNMNYRFVKDEPLNISRKRMKGYRPVLKEDNGVKTLVEADDQGDGLIRVGDTILMACPKGAFKRRQKEARVRAAGKLRIPKKKVKDLAKANKVRIIQNEED